MPDHQQPTPTALAHGPVKCSDIERVRRDVDECDVRVAEGEQAAATDRLERLRERDTVPAPHAQP